MFLARAASLRDRPNSLTASTVMPVRSTACSGVLGRGVPSSSGLAAYPALVRLRAVKSSVSTMIVAPRGRSAEVGLERGRVHRDQHVGRVAGVRMSWSAKCSWNDETPGSVPCGRPDLGREVRQRRQVVAEGRRLLGEPVTGELHAVAGVAREPDDHAVELLDLLGHPCTSFSLDTVRPAPLYRGTAPIVRRNSPTTVRLRARPRRSPTGPDSPPHLSRPASHRGCAARPGVRSRPTDRYRFTVSRSMIILANYATYVACHPTERKSPHP